MPYNFLDHTADVKFSASGKTVEEAFSQAALAMKETICGDIDVLEKKVKITGSDLGNLLYNFLEEILFLLDSEGFLIADVKDLKIDLDSLLLECVFTGDKAENYKFTNDVKAVTYNDLFVGEENGGWGVLVVLDV
jgi:SHS2 domain-containing protein